MISLVVPGFRGSSTVSLPLVCTYDFEVIAAKYLQALDDGEIPLLFLWSGTIFARAGDGGFNVMPVPWEKEASFRFYSTLRYNAQEMCFLSVQPTVERFSTGFQALGDVAQLRSGQRLPNEIGSRRPSQANGQTRSFQTARAGPTAGQNFLGRPGQEPAARS